MSPVIKCTGAIGLILAGFFSASLFGPPNPLLPDSQEATANSATPQLQPLTEGEGNSLRPAAATQLVDSGVTPANFTDGPNAPFGTVHAANYPQGPQADSPWTRSLAENQSPGFNIPELRPPTSTPSPATPGEGSFASLTPPPRLGDFQNRAGENPSPNTAQSGSTPAATFATQPSSPTSPWWQRPAGAAPPSAPQPWSTHPGSDMAATSASPTSWQEPDSSNSRRWHVVSDGDSLARLAERYLNDASRAAEIFEENRNVLSNPDVLPIGVELRIPEAGARPATVEVYDAEGVPHGDIHTRRRMVKLPELPATVVNSPVARLGVPQSVGPGN